MAKIKTQSIPPSLLAGYTKVFTVGNPKIFGFKKVGVNSTARNSQPATISKPALALQLEAAKWLVEQWQPPLKILETERCDWHGSQLAGVSPAIAL